MSLGDPDYTNRPAIVTAHDPHPDLERRDFAAIVERDSAASAASLALSGHAETIEDQVLKTMARAQASALRGSAVAAYPQLKGKTDTQIYEYVNNLQISTNPADQATYLRIVNESIAKAATALESSGVSSNTLGAAITRAAQSAGHNLSGATTDLSQLSTSGILTIAGVGFGSFILTGSAGAGIALGGIATAVQSPHLTDQVINLGGGLARGATQVVAAPFKGAMRTVNIIAGLGSPGLGETAQANALGFGNDMINSIAYTFDADFDKSTKPSNNPLLQEFLEQGEIFAPKELMPLVKYLKEYRNGGPISVLPTHKEMQEAGAFMAKIQNIVTPDDFIGIDERRRAGEKLTPEENQKYILGKYCMLINQNFIGEHALPPMSLVVRAAYEAENGAMTLPEAFASLSPQELSGLNSANFSWSEQQVANFENNVEGMQITLENLTKHGAVGLALTAYLALTYGLMMIQGVKAVVNKRKESKEAKAARRRLPNDEKTLSSKHRGSLQASLGDRAKTLGPVIAALSGAGVLAAKTEFKNGVQDLKLEKLGDTEYQTLLDLANSDSAKTGDIREAFFKLMETGNLSADQQEALAQRQDYYKFQDIMNRVDLFYKFAERGAIKTLDFGGQKFKIGKPAREQFKFTTVNQLFLGERPNNLYNHFNSADGRTLRMENPKGKTVKLKIRRQGDKYQYNPGGGVGWADFKLDDLKAGLVGATSEADDTDATS